MVRNIISYHYTSVNKDIQNWPISCLSFQVQSAQSYVFIEQHSQGEDLANRIHEKCITYLQKLRHFRKQIPVTINRKQNLLFCPMCKLASTYWTQFFRLLELFDNHTYITPYDIPIKDAPPTKQRLLVAGGQPSLLYKDFYKFLFVRDPYSRILSAYVDKLFAPNPVFWKTLAKHQIDRFRPKSQPRNPCGADLTFEEYVKAIVENHRKPQESGKVDCHDESFTGACHPCEINYNFVGKMENFTVDSNHILKTLHMETTIEALKKHGKELADMEATSDTVNSPFKWKADIKKCIPWKEALNRIWRKLQIRGVIGKQQLPLSEEEAESITKEEFIKLILKTQALTPYSERKQQRKEAFREIFASVPIKHLEELKVAYKTDFDFFEYNTEPADIFHINRATLHHYGYLEVK